jgi:hypothetical protein
MTSLGVWPRDHNMPLQRFTMGHMPGFAKVVCNTIALLRFLEVVMVPRPLLHRVSLGEQLCQFFTHPSKAHFPQYPKLVGKLFHTGHVMTPIVLGCLLL